MNVDWNKLVETARVKALWAKDKVMETWKSGNKGKGICIGGAVVVLWILSGLFGSDDLTFTRAVDDSMMSRLLSTSKSEIGDAFIHTESPYVRVLSVVDDGVLVCYVSGGGDILTNQFTDYMENLAALTGGTYTKIVHVSTEEGGYVDGASLKSGVYVRDGTFNYVSRDGADNTVESYSQITDEDEIKRYQDEVAAHRENAEAEKIAAEKARLEADKAQGQEWIAKSGVEKLYKTPAADVPQDRKGVRMLQVARMFGIEERPPEELEKFMKECCLDAKWDRIMRDGFVTKALQFYQKESKKYGKNFLKLNAIKAAISDLD